MVDLAIGITQLVEITAANDFFPVDGQIARLEHQRLGGDAVDVETRQQRRVSLPLSQRRQPGLTFGEQVDKKSRGAGFKPPGPELAFLKQQQQVKRVVDRSAGPVIAVVPAADLLPIQPGQFRGEHGIDISIGVTTDRRVSTGEGDVAQVVQVREQTNLAEFAHPGQEGEADMGVGALDDRVHVAQAIAHLAGDI